MGSGCAFRFLVNLPPLSSPLPPQHQPKACTKAWCLPTTGCCVRSLFGCFLPCGPCCSGILKLAGKPTGRGGGDVELDLQGTLPRREPRGPKAKGEGKGKGGEGGELEGGSLEEGSQSGDGHGGAGQVVSLQPGAQQPRTRAAQLTFTRSGRPRRSSPKPRPATNLQALHAVQKFLTLPQPKTTKGEDTPPVEMVGGRWRSSPSF